jgi:hypothetical protein
MYDIVYDKQKIVNTPSAVTIFDQCLCAGSADIQCRTRLEVATVPIGQPGDGGLSVI